MAETNSYAVWSGANYPLASDVLNTAPTYGDAINVLNGTFDPNSGGGIVNDPKDLREGVNNADGIPGTLKVPRVGRVIAGVEVDDTVGTYVQITAPFVSLGSQWGEDGAEYTGTLDTGCPVSPDPTLGTRTIKCVDELGQPEAGVTVDARFMCWPDGDTGIAYDAAIQQATSDADGIATFQLVRSASYQFRRGTSQYWYAHTLDDQPTGLLPPIIGMP